MLNLFFLSILDYKTWKTYMCVWLTTVAIKLSFLFVKVKVKLIKSYVCLRSNNTYMFSYVWCFMYIYIWLMNVSSCRDRDKIIGWITMLIYINSAIRKLFYKLLLCRYVDFTAHRNSYLSIHCRWAVNTNNQVNIFMLYLCTYPYISKLVISNEILWIVTLYTSVYFNDILKINV